MQTRRSAMVWSACGLAALAACSSDGKKGPSFPDQHPRVYLGTQAQRLKDAIAAHEPEAMRFTAMVDKWMADPSPNNIYDFQEYFAGIMGQLTGDPKYCKAAVASLDKFVASEEALVAQGSAPTVTGDSYLGIGPIIGNVVLTIDYCYSEVGDKRTRWFAYAQQAVWNVWNHETAMWGGKTMPWSGWSVDNPVNNYYFSFLRATMLLGLVGRGEADGADAWIPEFHDTKILGELVPTFTSDLVGGGSREGTGYGVSMRSLFEEMDWWTASTGEDLSTKTPHTRASMLAMIHETVPTLDRIAPIGDHTRDSAAPFFDYHRQYLLELMHLFPNDPVTPVAKTFLDGTNVPEMGQQFMYVYDFYYPTSAMTGKPLDTLNTAYFAPGIGNLYARGSWDADASWIALVAGPFTESHAHQDQGSILFYKGEWLGYDPNIDSQSGIRQENDAHNLVRVIANGQTVEQKVNTTSTMLGLKQGDGWLYAAADLTPAYAGDSHVQKLQRELVFIQPDVLVVYDRVTTAAGTSLDWQLASPVRATANGNAATITGQHHALHVQNIVPGIAPDTSHAFPDDSSDYHNGFRTDFVQSGGDKRFLTVLSPDGVVTSATASGADGVTLQLAGGGTATVTFSHDAVGGTYTPAGGSAITLGAGVSTLKE